MLLLLFFEGGGTAAVTTIRQRRTLSTLGTRAGDRQVQGNNNG